MSVTLEVSQEAIFPYRTAARVASLHQASTFNCMVLQEPIAEPSEVRLNMPVVVAPLVSQQSCMLKSEAPLNIYSMVVTLDTAPPAHVAWLLLLLLLLLFMMESRSVVDTRVSQARNRLRRHK